MCGGFLFMKTPDSIGQLFATTSLQPQCGPVMQFTSCGQLVFSTSVNTKGNNALRNYAQVHCYLWLAKWGLDHHAW